MEHTLCVCAQHEEKIQLNTELYNLRNTYGDNVFAQFLNDYPAYQKIVERVNNNISLELIDLTTFRNLVKSFREYAPSCIALSN